MSNILDKIIATKKQEVAAGKIKHPLSSLTARINDLPPCRGFINNIRQTLTNKQTAVIAEIKKASPSKGIIRPDFDAETIAQSYQAGGATCLSILTDKDYFQGNDDYLRQVREVVKLPILRKDFMIDPWHIYHSRLIGADCILLIVSALQDTTLVELTELSHNLGLDVLMEVHDEFEMERALNTSAQLIGINNRNLKTFKTSLKTSERLAKMVPNDRIVVSESGIHSQQDLQFLIKQSIHTFLIGESLMRHPDPGAQLKHLINL